MTAGSVTAEVFGGGDGTYPAPGGLPGAVPNGSGVVAGVAGRNFDRRTVLPAWTVRELIGHLVHLHAGFLASLDQPTRDTALPIYEFVTRYRRDVEMIMAATLEASAGLTGPEVVARLESAIDDLAGRLEAGVRLAQVIMTPTWSHHDRGLPRDSNRRAGGTHRRSQSISSGHAAGAVAPQCSRPLYAYPRRDPRRTAPRALRRSESAAVRRGAVRDRRSRADSYPRHPAERGGDQPADFLAAGDRPYHLDRCGCCRSCACLGLASQSCSRTPSTLLTPDLSESRNRIRCCSSDKSEARWSSKVLITRVWVPDHLNPQWRRCPMCGTMIDLDRPDQSCPCGELSPLRRSYL